MNEGINPKIAVMKFADLADQSTLSQPGTVGINPILNDLNTPELQNWSGGTLKPIKLIGMNSGFAKN